MNLNVIITRLDCFVIGVCNGLNLNDPLRIATGQDKLANNMSDSNIASEFEVYQIVNSIKKVGLIYGIILLLVSIIGLIFLESAQGRDEQKKKIVHILKGLFILGSMSTILYIIYYAAAVMFG